MKATRIKAVLSGGLLGGALDIAVAVRKAVLPRQIDRAGTTG